MKRLLLVSAVSLVALTSAPAMARDVGVSISIGQPGFFGNVNIGRFAEERVIYAPPAVAYVPAVSYRPVYAYPQYGRQYAPPRYWRREYEERCGWRGRDFDRGERHWGYRGDGRRGWDRD